jgi:hypothetical protein
LNKHKEKKLLKVNKKIGIREKKYIQKDRSIEWEVTSTSTGQSASTTASVYLNKMACFSPEFDFQ